jgi:hypothetical protein
MQLGCGFFAEGHGAESWVGVAAVAAVAAVGELNTGPDSCIMKQESANRGKGSILGILCYIHFDFATFLLLQDFLVIEA